MRHLLCALAAIASLLPAVTADAQTYYLRAKGVPNAPPAACSVSLVGTVPTAVRGTPFGMSFRTTQPAPAPLGHGLVGTPPPGLVFNAATQTLTGTPTAAGRFGPLRVAVTSRGSASGDFCKSDEFYVEVAPADCAAPWGATVAHGASVLAFFQSSVPFGSTCDASAQSRSCDDGALAGSAPNRDCVVTAAANCTTPWGQSVAHGTTAQGFTTAVAPFGASCSGYQQARTCSNGVLSGTAENASCSIAAPTYSWSTGGFGSCSATCGGGTQSRSVSCVRQDGVAVADFNCTSPRPATSQSCNTQACASKTCGPMRFRTTTSGGYEIDMTRNVWSESSCVAHCQAHPDIAACAYNSTGLCFRWGGNPSLVGQHSGSWSSQTIYAALCR